MRMHSITDNIGWTKLGVKLRGSHGSHHIIEEFYKIKDSLNQIKIVNKLIIKRLNYDDRGIYTCSSDNGAQKNFELHFDNECKK